MIILKTKQTIARYEIFLFLNHLTLEVYPIFNYNEIGCIRDA